MKSPSVKTKSSASAKWDAAEYAANSVVQQTWARELIGKLGLRGTEQILDVGCGDGKVTAEIARAVPNGSATGIDASTEMISFAEKTFPKKSVSNLEFHVMDAREIEFDRKFDLVFSNAALHWVDDHQKFLAGAASVLKPGGPPSGFVRGQRQRTGRFCRLAARIARQNVAWIFSPNTRALFLLRAR